jgi:hypothetical protein
VVVIIVRYRLDQAPQGWLGTAGPAAPEHPAGQPSKR